MNDTTRDKTRTHPQDGAGLPAETPEAGKALATGTLAAGARTAAAAADALPGPAEVLRFRLAALRARLALLGVAFDPDTDEPTLRRMLCAAENATNCGDAPTGPTGPDDGDGMDGGGVTTPPSPAKAAPPPSEVLRRETARHLRQRQREAAQDAARAAGHAPAHRAGGSRGQGVAPRPTRRRERGKA